MEGAIIWLTMALIVAWIGSTKGRSFVGWFIYGIFLWPIALIHVALISNESMKCPKCYSKIDIRATICKHCKHTFTSDEIKENNKAFIRSRNRKFIVIASVILILSLSTYLVNIGSNEQANISKPATVDPQVDEKWLDDAAQRYYNSHKDMFSDLTDVAQAKKTMKLCLEDLKSKDECNDIIDKKYWIGMTDTWAVISIGNPRDINKTVTANKNHEQWVYGDVLYGANYLYFEDGILTSYQE